MFSTASRSHHTILHILLTGVKYSTMRAITILPVCILFVVMIYTDIGSTDALITCEAGTFVEGKPASISCKFRTNITASKRSINMALYPPDKPKGEIGKDILLCRWLEEKMDHLCFLEESSYTFDNILTDRLTVGIPAVSFGQAGLYMCFFVPPEGTDAYPCELIVVSGETKENQNLLLIILPCVGGVAVVAFCVGFVVLKRSNKRKSSDDASQEMLPLKPRKIEELLDDFQLTKSTLKKVMQLMKEEMSKGPNEPTRKEAGIQMFPTFVSPLPDGSENGEFLALEFDGSCLKAFLVKLQGHSVGVLKSERYPVTSDIKLGDTKQLFYFMADRTNDFIKDHNVLGEILPLVLIVAFPCQYEALDKARFTKWIKEKHDDGCMDGDIHSLLLEAITERKKKKILTPSRFDNLGKLEVVAVVNDAVSTLMSVADKIPNCKIGLIAGNGLNACYVKYLTNVETDCPEDDKPHEVVVNTELGALGDNGCLDFCRTDFDKLLDKHLDKQSNVSKCQILEKMVGGRYIGELLRLVLEELTKEGLLFRSVPSRDALFKKNSFSTEMVLKIEDDTEDTKEPYKQTAETLNGLGVTHFSQEDLQIVRQVCRAVCERAAFLTAASLATLVNRVKQPEVTVVVDGYLYLRHPRFHDLMYNKTLELVKPELKFYLVSPRYERSIGAARIVAASLRSRNPQTVNA